MEIIDCVRTLMEMKQITAYKLSKDSGISQSTVSNILRRGNNPSLDTLQRICKGLNISLVEFCALLESEEKSATIDVKEYLETKDFLQGYLKLNNEGRACVMQMIHLLTAEQG